MSLHLISMSNMNCYKVSREWVVTQHACCFVPVQHLNLVISRKTKGSINFMSLFSLLSQWNIMYHVTTSLYWAACHLKFLCWEPEWTLTCVLCVFCVCVYVFFFCLQLFFFFALSVHVCFSFLFCNMALLCYNPLLCGHFFSVFRLLYRYLGTAFLRFSINLI